MALRCLLFLALVGLLAALHRGESRTLLARSDSASDAAGSDSAGSDSDSSSAGEDDSNSREDANGGATCAGCANDNDGMNDANNVDPGGDIPCADVQECEERALFDTGSVTLLNRALVAELIDNNLGTLSVADTFAQTLRELNANGASECSDCTNQGSTTIRCIFVFLVGSGNPSPELVLTVADSSERPLVVESFTFTTVDAPVYGQARATYANPQLADNNRAFTSNPTSVEIKLPGSSIFIPFGPLGPVEEVCTVSRQCRVGIDTNPTITVPPPVFTGAGRIATLQELADVNTFSDASDLAKTHCPNNV